MAEALTGLCVHVTLKSGKPPVTGTVLGVHDSILHLKNASQHGADILPYAAFPGSDIADLEVLPHGEENRNPFVNRFKITQSQPSSHSNTPQASIISNTPTKHSFHDPAILSFDRASRQRNPIELPSATTPDSQAGKSTQISPQFPSLDSKFRPPNGHEIPLIGHAPKLDNVANKSSLTEKPKRNRRSKRTKVPVSVDDLPDSSPELQKAHAPGVQPGTGWRNLPILKPVPPTENPRGKQGHRDRLGKHESTRSRSAWATGNVSDVQELGDFDFAENLKMFDKRSVFEQIRIDDTTADEDLLVTHNRARPVREMRKLKASENVLTGLRASPRSSSEEELVSTPKSLGRSNSSNRPELIHRNSGPRISDEQNGQGLEPHLIKRESFKTTSKKSVAFLRHSTSGRKCAAIDASLLLDAEDYAVAHLYLSEDIIVENAGRSIAEIALLSLNPGGHRMARGNHNVGPLVVLLLGDERSSAIALAAGRHMQERGVRIVAGVVHESIFRAEEEDDYQDSRWSLKLQAKRFGKSQILAWAEAATLLKTLDAPPELIIDALYGKENFCELLTTDVSSKDATATALQMMAWANKSSAFVLAIDLPAGVDSIDGSVRMYEGEPAEIRAKIIVCCGAPTVGLRNAMLLRQHGVGDWRVWVCDTGINQSLKRMTKNDGGYDAGKWIDFEGKWYTQLRL